MKSKKGFLGDYMLYMVLLFVLAVGILVIYYVFSTINTSWQAAPGLTDQSKSMVSDFTTRFVGVWDFFYLLLVVGFALVTIILGFALRSHPVFAMLGLLIMLILGMVSVFLANAYNSIASTSAFSSINAEFTFMSFLTTKLPHIVLILGALFLIVLYAKNKNQAVI